MISPEAVLEADEIKPVVRYFDVDKISHELALEMRDGAVASAPNGAEWKFNVVSKPVSGQPDARDYRFTWTVTKGEAQSAAVGIVFEFKDWSPQNFVFAPAAVYDGNRFAVKNMDYPPYWYNKNEWRIDMPTTINNCPTLGQGPGPGRIDITTGNLSVPIMAFQSPASQTSWMVQTMQASRFGNYGMSIEEDAGRTTARFTITAPAVRPGNKDHAADWKTGDTVTIPCRVYQFAAHERAELLSRFFDARKDLNPAVRAEQLPYSAAWQLLDALYQDHRWDEKTGLYWLSDPASGRTDWGSIWQLGWCGGGQATLSMLLRGDDVTRQRVLRNLEVILSKTQAPSGFFNAIGNGTDFGSFGLGSIFKNHECLVRSQGDWLYMAQRQFNQIEARGGSIPPEWTAGLKKQADAFEQLWKKRGQFGQFVDVETGDLCIGSSTSGAIVPGGLALASRRFHDPEYLTIAEAAARQYYHEYVHLGYTTGGPGEILSAPDSESAFALFESFITLHEVTGEAEWLHAAAEELPICASWVVPYDYQFPPNSPMGSIDAHSCGAVWANLQNKHGAPAICTWSGDSLLKYFRATGDKRALDLLTDIAHGVTQYISRQDRRVGSLSPGGICERVNLSDWEGPDTVGGRIFGSCSWTETAAMLTVTQLPGLYVQPNTGVVAVFDNIRMEKISSDGKALRLRLTNPTAFPADVTVLAESSQAAQRPVSTFTTKPLPTVHLDAGASCEVEYR